MTFDILRTLISISLVVTNLYMLGLWCYFLTRARPSFAWALAASSAGALFASIVSLCFTLDFRLVQRSLGPSLFDMVYWIYLSVQPLVLLLHIIGATILVRFLLHRDLSSPTKA
jgi:hypothetical protein